MKLQRSIGNQSVQHLIRSSYIQAKLRVSTPGDQFEQEADRVADTVMGMPDGQTNAAASVSSGIKISRIQRECKECEKEKMQRQPEKEEEEETKTKPAAASTTVVQRLCPECDKKMQKMPVAEEEKEEPKKEQEEKLQGKAEGEEEEEGLQVSDDVQSQVENLSGSGQPMPKSLQTYFEPRFGHSFSGVRLHTGSQAARLARSVNAVALTVGNNVAFSAGQYSPDTTSGKRLIAHELTHVVQQGAAGPQTTTGEGSKGPATAQRTSGPGSSPSDVIQRAGDPTKIPPGFPCPTDFTAGPLPGTDIKFATGSTTISAAHTAQLTTFMATWVSGGGTDDILVHGYASTIGDDGPNWTLSCRRAEAVRDELIRLGIPAVRINIDAHGESTDFGSSAADNQHAIVSSSPRGFIQLPICFGTLTPRDNFAGRSTTQFGIGEIIDLDFFCFPPTPAASLGGLEWHIASGGGALSGVTDVGTGTYTAPATGGPVVLELRVARGATAGRVISTQAITIVIPTAVRMTEVPGTAPTFGGVIPAGTWGAGFQANPFIEPRNVSFQGVMFGEGTVAAVVTPAGSFLSARHGLVHPAGGLVPGGPGNAATGTPALGTDSIATAGGVTPTRVFGVDFCGTSDFLWAIPWEFSVSGGPRTPFAGGFTANHHVTSTLLCNATIEKAGAGPFCRRINGTTC